MKTRLSFSLLLASILAAAPAFAGVCDLSCASVAGPGPSSPYAVSRGTPSHEAAAECPLHSAEDNRPTPAAPSSGPCHGSGAGGRSAVLLASASAAAAIAPASSPVLVSAFALRTSMARAVDGSSEPASGRMPRSSPLPSILRL